LIRKRLTAVLLACASLGIFPPAQAGLFDDEEARKQIVDLRKLQAEQKQAIEDRLNKLDESIRNLGVIQLLQQIEMLNAEIAKLRGQIEVLNFHNEQLQKRQRDFYVDLDSRIRRLEGGDAAAAGAPPAQPGGSTGTAAATRPATAAPAATAPAPAATPNPAAENKAYDTAQNLFKKGDYAKAVDAFSSFLQSFPGSNLAANAQYWIGISHFNLKDFKNAQAAQESLVKLYPESPKVPDALLAIGTLQIEQGDNGSARNTLEDIIAKYPGTEAAAKARTRLQALRR
jgi:tol-pal system protein YbgF